MTTVSCYALRDTDKIGIKIKYPLSNAISIVTHLCLPFDIESPPDTRLLAVALRGRESRIIKGTVKYRRTSAACARDSRQSEPRSISCQRRNFLSASFRRVLMQQRAFTAPTGGALCSARTERVLLSGLMKATPSRKLAITRPTCRW